MSDPTPQDPRANENPYSAPVANAKPDDADEASSTILPRARTVRRLGWLHAAFGLVLILLALVFLSHAGQSFRAASHWKPGDRHGDTMRTEGNVTALLGVAFAILAVLNFALARALRRFRPWARRAAVAQALAYTALALGLPPILVAVTGWSPDNFLLAPTPALVFGPLGAVLLTRRTAQVFADENRTWLAAAFGKTPDSAGSTP